MPSLSQNHNDRDPFQGMPLPSHIRVPLQDVQRVVCDNGLTVFLAPMPHTQELSVSALIKVGLPQEGDRGGITHFTEHLLGAGGTNYPSGELLDDALSEDGGGFRLSTYPDRIVITLDGLARSPEIFLNVFKDIWALPAFNGADVDRERKVIDREIRQRSSGLMDAADQILMSLSFAGSPFEKPIPGTRHSIRSITQEHLREYHRTYMGPQNTYVVFSGALPHGFAEQIQRELGSIVFPQGLVTTPPSVLPVRLTQIYAQSGPPDTTLITLGVPGFSAGAAEVGAVDVLNVALCGRMNSRLMRVLRGTNGETYGVIGNHDDMWGCGIEKFSFFSNPGDEVKLLNLFKREIGDVVKNGLTREEFHRAVGFARSQCIRMMERPQMVASNLVVEAAFQGSTNHPQGLHRKLTSLLSITNEDVSLVARKLFSDAKWQVVLLGENAPFVKHDVLALFMGSGCQQ